MIYYQLTAKVVQITLAKIVEKMKKDIALTDGDQVTIYELAFTFYVIINQSNNLFFSTLHLPQLHIENEKMIYRSKKIQPPKSILLSDTATVFKGDQA